MDYQSPSPTCDAMVGMNHQVTLGFKTESEQECTSCNIQNSALPDQSQRESAHLVKSDRTHVLCHFYHEE